MRWREALSAFRAGLGVLHGGRTFGGPVQVSIGLADRCNLNCIHCYFHSPRAEYPNRIAVRKARLEGRFRLPEGNSRPAPRPDADAGCVRSVMDEAIAMGTCRFQFGGSGEPLLHGDALDLIAHAKGAGCFCRVNTNGLLLNRSTADAMLDMGLDQISMTTLAGDEEAFRGTHAGCSAGTFGQLRENLIYLCGRKRELGLGRPKVNANCIVISANCDRLSDIARFCQTVGLDGLFFKPLDDVQDPGLARVAPTERQARRVRDELPGVAAYLDEHAMRHNVSSFLAVFNRRADTTEVYRHIPCYYGWLVALIDVDGQVYPCCRCYVAQGNAYETGLGDIWRSKAYALFRQEAARLRDRGKPLDGCVCNSCTNYAVNLRVFKALHPLRRLPRPLG